MDAFVAGLNLGIPADKIEDAYVGEFRNDAEYAEQQIGTLWEIPEFIEPYIDWEHVARDSCGSFHSEEKHYFLTDY
jgi:antirestriction protein